MKFASPLVLACFAGLLVGAAHAQEARERGSAFAMASILEIDAVASFTPPEFAIGTERDSPFAFYGDAMNPVREVTCERSASFGIVAKANLAGAINVGICVREAKRVRSLAVAAQPELAAVLAKLIQGGARIDTAAFEKAGWTYTRTIDAGGAEVHYFPMLLIGHGILQLQTLVRVTRGSRAVVVQADTYRLCENYGLRGKTALCDDTPKALADIARRIDARFKD